MNELQICFTELFKGLNDKTLLDLIADTMMNLLESCIEKGFTREEALQIILNLKPQVNR